MLSWGWLFFLLTCFPCLISCYCTVDPSTAACYQDDSSHRALGYFNMNFAYQNSNEWCSQLCYNVNQQWAGTQGGLECYCGNKIRDGAVKVPMSDCNTPCNYNNNNTISSPLPSCGGEDKLLIVKVNCTNDNTVNPPEDPSRPYLYNPCMDPHFEVLPFCNYSLSLDDRIDDMIARMTLTEKINMLGSNNSAIPSIGLKHYNWWNEASHGVASGRRDELFPFTTNFALPITSAMSFNRTIWHKTGSSIGMESRALMNAGYSFSTFWAPVVNLAVHPKWGRNGETPGEDPLVSSEYAKWFIKGIQENSLDPNHLQASASCKHFVGNELEDTTENGIHHWRREFDASISIRDLVDSYLVPFQACVQQGHVSSLMCSYNSVNGTPSCANSWLLEEIARSDWGFDGYIVADCDAVEDVIYHHNYTITPEETVAAVLRAGMDLDCGGFDSFVQRNALSALEKGFITLDDINARIAKLLRVRLRLSHFDPIGPLDKIDPSIICSEETKSLAREAVTQSVTLVKNINSRLPLQIRQNNSIKHTNQQKLTSTSYNPVETIAVIGPNALLSSDIAGYYGPPRVCDEQFNTVFDSIKAQIGEDNLFYAVGVQDPLTDDMSHIQEAVNLAEKVDLVIAVLGTDLSVAAEGYDAVSLSYSKAQLALIDQLTNTTKAKGSPIIIITLTAVPLDLSPFLINDNVGAILHAGQPSVQTLGIGDILFGIRSPSGRLVQTIYPKQFENELSIFDFNLRPGPSAWLRPDCNPSNPSKLKHDSTVDACINGTNPGLSYRFYNGEAVLPFGFGLSYTRFEYDITNISHSTIDREDIVLQVKQNTTKSGLFLDLSNSDQGIISKGSLIQFCIRVTNTGPIDSSDTILGFIIPPNAGLDGLPLKYLFDFEKVFVQSGSSAEKCLKPSLKDLTWVTLSGSRSVYQGILTFQFGLLETKDKGQGFADTTVPII